jgi:hypothetical protein
MTNGASKPFIVCLGSACHRLARRFLKRNFIDPASFFKRLKQPRLP